MMHMNIYLLDAWQNLGICGGSASGKTTVAQKIIESLDVPWVTLLSMDCFYKVILTGHNDNNTTTKSRRTSLIYQYVFSIDFVGDAVSDRRTT